MAGALEQNKDIVNKIEGDNRNGTFEQREKNSLSTIKQHEVINRKEWRDFMNRKTVKLDGESVPLYELVQNLEIDDSKNPNKPEVIYKNEKFGNKEIGWGSEAAALIQLYVLSFGSGVGKQTGIDGKIGPITTRAIRRIRGDKVGGEGGKDKSDQGKNRPRTIEQAIQNKAVEFVRKNCNNLKTPSRFVDDWIKENRITFTCESTDSYGKIRITGKGKNVNNFADIDINELYPKNGGVVDKSKGFSKWSLDYAIMDAFHNTFYNKFLKKCRADIILSKEEQRKIDLLPRNQQAMKYHDLCGKCNLILSKINGYEGNVIGRKGNLYKYEGGKYNNYFEELKNFVKKRYDEYSKKENER